MAASHPALVIVESPTKARTIRQYLGDGYRVMASMGHVRDLPTKKDRVPGEVKERSADIFEESRRNCGVDIEKGFKPKYVVPEDKRKVVAELREALSDASELLIATDEDREGESIGWHLVELLKPKVPTRRMVFHEITPEAIRSALKHTREIDERLVTAQETRRIIDRLVGFLVSPLMWVKLRNARSAGRVQSPAVSLIVKRELERLAFTSASYWDLTARLQKQAVTFDATLATVDGRRVAQGRDFDETTGRLTSNDVLLLDQARAESLRASLEGQQARVTQVERRTVTKSPYPPFTTSTLQQEANRKLGFSSRTTMSLAQRLYERGHITYMRTDSTSLSDQAIGALRGTIAARYGESFVSKAPRQFETKTKGAQEAHEAIRPAGIEMPTAEELGLSDQEGRLYDLIWKRAVATQMAEARLAYTTAEFRMDARDGAKATFKASGREVVFAGFLRAYVEGSDDPTAALDDQSTPLPTLVEGEDVASRAVRAVGHETRPPARYTEATLIRDLEKSGVGRPSTYASIIDSIQAEYVVIQDRQLVPTFSGIGSCFLIERALSRINDTELTADMEARLDQIRSQADATRFLTEFYDGFLAPGIEAGRALPPEPFYTLEFPCLAPYVVHVGAWEPVVTRPAIGDRPAVRFKLTKGDLPSSLSRVWLEERERSEQRKHEPLGIDPKSGLPIFALTGQFGPYLRVGAYEPEPETAKDDTAKRGKGKKKFVNPPGSRTVSLPKGVTPATVTLELALELLKFPRALGEHPETGQPVMLMNLRYGPCVKHGTTLASLGTDDRIDSITLERAVQLLRDKESRPRGPAPIRVIGPHPADGSPVGVYAGKWGPYVKHGSLNATMPRDADPMSYSLEEAIELLAAKAAAPPTQKRGRRGAPSRTAAASKTKAKAKPAKAAGGTTASRRPAAAKAAKPATAAKRKPRS